MRFATRWMYLVLLFVALASTPAKVPAQSGYHASFSPSANPSVRSGAVAYQEGVITEVPQVRAPAIELDPHAAATETTSVVSPQTDKEPEAAGGEVDLGMSAKWNNGLELSTKDKAFRVHVGGRTQFDAGWFAANENVQNNINIPFENGVDFRRARFRIDGTMFDTIEWAAEYDFVNAARIRNAGGNGTADLDVTALTDMWWQFKELPLVQNVRIGNQKEPIGFEHLVSSRFLPFMERSYNQDSFYGGSFNGFTPGVQIFGNPPDEMSTWAVGVFKPTDNVFAYNSNSGDYAVTGRLTRLWWYGNEGAELLHVGASFRQFSTVNERIRYRTRDAIRTGVASVWPLPADTGLLFGEDGTWLNGELVGVAGPWTLQAEYLVNLLTEAQVVGPPAGPVVGDLMYHGGYIQLLYFLTGEHEHYDRKKGFFERVIPHENYHVLRNGCGPLFGRGAWQVGARYNFLDLNDDGINGGQLHNGTLGLNWFLNPNMKMQFNYIVTKRQAPFANDAGDGWINGWGIRVAHDF